MSEEEDIKKKRGGYKKAWTEKDLAEALAAVANKEEGTNEAAKKRNIPPSTLKTYLKKGLATASVLGRPTILQKNMENELKAHLLGFEERMFGLTITDVRKLAYDLAEKMGLKHNFNRETKLAGKKWYYNFMRRHPELSLRQLEATSMARIKGFSRVKVCAKASCLYKHLKQQEGEGSSALPFAASRGWFDRFKRRSNLYSTLITGEAKTETITAFPNQLNTYILQEEISNEDVSETDNCVPSVVKLEPYSDESEVEQTEWNAGNDFDNFSAVLAEYLRNQPAELRNKLMVDITSKAAKAIASSGKQEDVTAKLVKLELNLSDYDYQFILSILPFLKKLDPLKKEATRMQIMQFLINETKS